MYSLLEGPFIVLSKPGYELSKIYPNIYVGSTFYFNHWYSVLVTLFGFVIAIFRLRDNIIMAKVRNIYY